MEVCNPSPGPAFHPESFPECFLKTLGPGKGLRRPKNAKPSRRFFLATQRRSGIEGQRSAPGPVRAL
eukprot:6628411-Pyramimonas_sp.AAC.1